MAAQKGKDLLLKIDDGTGTFVTVAGLRTQRLALNADAVDVTHAESAGRWRELAADLRRRDPSAAPILLGGLGFTGERPPADDVWAGFGASSLVLHELTWEIGRAHV